MPYLRPDEEVKVTINPDGTRDVELPTGEKFHGTPDELFKTMGRSHSETKRWAQDKTSTLEQENARIKAEAEAHNAQAQQQVNADPGNDRIFDWLAEPMTERVARGLGFDSAASARAFVEVQRNEALAGTFQQENPDFPNTQEAIDAISRKIDQIAWTTDPRTGKPVQRWDENTMARAHNLCKIEGAYKPLTDEEQKIAISKTAASPPPPPPPPGNTVNHQTGTNDPWAMKLDDLRKQALDGQLAGGK